MPRVCFWMLLAASMFPAMAAAQDTAYNDALGRAMSGYFAGRLIETQNELGQLIQIGAADPRAYYFRGLCAWQMGRTADAQRDFARGAELEQADPEHWSEVSTSLTRVQGTARRSLENYRGPARMALARQRDARRLAHYGIGPSRPPIEQVAAASVPAATAPPAAALPMPQAAPAAAPDEKPAADPFAAPAATEKPAAPAEDPFAAPAARAASPMPTATADKPAAASAEPAATPPPAEPPAAEPPTASLPTASAQPAAADASTPEGSISAGIAAIDQPQNLWPLLPAQYQSDIQSLVNQFGDKMDSELWAKTFAVLKKLVKVGKDKRELILKQPMLAAVPGGKEEMAQNWDRIMELLDTLLGSEISTVEGLKTFDPAAFLTGTGGKIVKLLADAPPAAGAPAGPSLAQLKAAKVSTAKTEGDSATVNVAVEGKPPIDVQLKRVDGKWLPAQMVDGWTEKVAAAKASLEQLNVAAQKPQGMMMLQMADGVLDQLLAAKDEAAFNAALAPILALLGRFAGKLPAGGAMPFPGAPPMGAPGAAPMTPAP
ncbi:MAG TPA: hypothetical protein VHV55_19640 [Pirellulales bacterium]|nr:hypothetical protein [Pirellulales bacterium]